MYIAKRWTWEAASSSVNSLTSGCKLGNPAKDMSYHYNIFLHNFVKIASKVAESKTTFQFALNGLDALLHDTEKVPIEECTIDSSTGTET